MRAFVYPALLTLCVVMPLPGQADTSVPAAALHDDITTASAELSKVAAREAFRLSATVGDTQVEAAEKHQQRAGKANNKAVRGKALLARLKESERLRIRDKYRKQQLKRIALQAREFTGESETISSSD